ncbi:response regulator transcription factor [Pseudomonas sp. EL_65y_Pfl2_R95]|uniref:response regulator transcription factor n=1 Tax=Pseudomonas sp. EL_65y_Pfl2_R95 TaxID=3088698 RepID=UPI0030DBFF67
MQNIQLHKTAVIAVVDDDEPIRIALQSLLRSSGYQVKSYCSALAFINSNGPAQTQCLISDIQMPGMSGVEMLEYLNAQGFTIPVIFITGYPGAACIAADTPQFVACLPKPFAADKLLSHIETTLQTKR